MLCLYNIIITKGEKNMKKNYLKPEMEMQKFNSIDVMSGSNEGEWDVEGGAGGNEGEWDVEGANIL
jgi:hypothetical protein